MAAAWTPVCHQATLAELERQLDSQKQNARESEDMQNDALASLEETIQGLEAEKVQLEDTAEQKDEMIKKLQQDVRGLQQQRQAP
eukprot:SAG22_NODE_9188_length_604_cov_1.112871_1_plen_84_part_10